MAYTPASLQSGSHPSVADPSWRRVCVCGSPTTNTFYPEARMYPLCDGCRFRFRVMCAAGRRREYMKDYDEKVRSLHTYQYTYRYITMDDIVSSPAPANEVFYLESKIK